MPYATVDDEGTLICLDKCPIGSIANTETMICEPSTSSNPCQDPTMPYVTIDDEGTPICSDKCPIGSIANTETMICKIVC